MNKKLNYVINLTFLGYFLILLTERLISVIRSFVNIGFKNMYSSFFGAFVYTVVIVSLVAFVVYFAMKCRSSLKGVCNMDAEVDFKELCSASAIILLSGMLHTEYTIAVVQFISYGVLIVGLLLKFISMNKAQSNKVDFWLAFAYLVVFSMAIPVSYPSAVSGANAFHTLEFVTSVGLVCAFGYFIYSLFNENYKAIYNPFIFIATIVLDAGIISWRWKEEVNTFLLIFASASLVVYLVAFILRKTKTK